MAPSPTGNLHIGTIRTALFNWLFARHYNGIFILRIEDTDQERSRPEFEENIQRGLQWLGLKWDEFYRQSERLEIYKKYLQKLLETKKAFWCYHSVEELEVERRGQMERKEAPRHICKHKYEKPADKPRQIIRLAVNENSTRIIHFDDIIRGRIEFEQRTMGDLSLAKNENTPLYNLAVVVDDYEMKISHIIRGEDHIANTPKQILIAEALATSLPKLAHLPLILGKDRSKLSKRHGATMFEEYLEAGYLPEALINFLALLGWTPTENQNLEILEVAELIELFKLERVHRAGAVFDIKKLNWINAQHLKKLSDEELTEKIASLVERHFGEQDRELILKLIPLFRERLEYLDQIKEYKYFFQEPEYETGLLVWKKLDRTEARRALELVRESLGNREGEIFDEHQMRVWLDQLAREQFGGDRGAIYWPLRVALSGERFSPDPINIMKALTKEQILKRVKKAIGML